MSAPGENARRSEYGVPRLRPVRWLVLFALCMLTVLALAGRFSDVAVGPKVSISPSRARFVANEQLAPILSFTASDSPRTPARYQARISQLGAARWDTLTFGEAETEGLLFRVTLRSAQATSARPGLFVELAKQSAEIGAAIVHATSPQSYATQRGPIEWADVTLSGQKADRRCLGFRLARAGDIDISGLACGAHGSSLDPVGLGCLIDRLSATAAGLEAGLSETFRRDAAHSAACPRSLG